MGFTPRRCVTLIIFDLSEKLMPLSLYILHLNLKNYQQLFALFNVLKRSQKAQKIIGALHSVNCPGLLEYALRSYPLPPSTYSFPRIHLTRLPSCPTSLLRDAVLLSISTPLLLSSRPDLSFFMCLLPPTCVRSILSDQLPVIIVKVRSFWESDISDTQRR